MVLSRNREALPTETVSKRCAAANLPMVAGVKSILLPPHRVWIAKLVRLASTARQSQQELRPGSECICSGNVIFVDCSRQTANTCSRVGRITSFQCRRRAAELE